MENVMAKHYIGACKDVEVRNNSSSGGIFTVLSNYVFDNDGIVFAATYDQYDYSIKHIMINNADELWKVRKSKYVWSNFKGIEIEMREQIAMNRLVMFVGTPCQAAYIRNKYGFYKKLFVVDLFCHGTAEPFYFRDYLELIDGKVRKIDFRGQSKHERSNFQFVITSDNGILEESFEENIFTKAYAESLIMKKSCFSCKLSENIHVSDITLGDFEWPDRAQERNVRVLHPSIISVNTEYGTKIFDNIKNNLYISDIVTEDEVAFYYRSHSEKGAWGYNIAEKEKFEEDYKKWGFKEAVYRNLFQHEINYLEKIYKYMQSFGIKNYYLYGNGCMANRLHKLITELYPDCIFLGNIVTNKKLDEKSRVIAIDEYDFEKKAVIVVAVSKKYVKDICEELIRCGVKWYIYDENL